MSVYEVLVAAERAGSPDAIADRLCEAWQTKPSARIARIVESLDACTTRVVTLAGKTVPKREQAWCEAVAEADESELVALLRIPWPTRLVHAHERMDVLEERDPSARISNALLALERRKQYHLRNLDGTLMSPRAGVELSERIAALLTGWRDPAITPKLEPKLSPKARAVLERIELVANTIARDDQQLLAAIYEAPFDDGPRAVFADHLQLSGDPLGELIALQLANTDPARQRQLLRQAGTAWTDELLADGAQGVEHARGFPAKAKAIAYDFRSPAWSTIESLELAGDATFRGSPNLRGLRELRRLRTSDLSAITQIGDDRRDRPLELLSLVGFEGFEAKTLLAPAQLELLYDVRLGLEAWYSALANLGEMLAHVSVGRRVSSFVLPEQLRGSRLERTLRNRIEPVFVFNPYLYMPA